MKQWSRSLSSRERFLAVTLIVAVVGAGGERVLRTGYLARRSDLLRQIARQEGLLARGQDLVQQAEAIRTAHEALQSRLRHGSHQATNEAQLLRELERAAQSTVDLVSLDPTRTDEASSLCEVRVEFHGALAACADFMLFLGQRLNGECLSLTMTVNAGSDDNLRCQSIWQFTVMQSTPQVSPDSSGRRALDDRDGAS